MTDSPQSQATEVQDREGRATSPAWRRRLQGDIHVGSLAGNARRVPGAGTAKGDKAIAKAMGDVLDRVRRSIRERATGPGRVRPAAPFPRK